MLQTLQVNNSNQLVDINIPVDCYIKVYNNSSVTITVSEVLTNLSNQTRDPIIISNNVNPSNSIISGSLPTTAFTIDTILTNSAKLSSIPFKAGSTIRISNAATANSSCVIQFFDL